MSVKMIASLWGNRGSQKRIPSASNDERARPTPALTRSNQN